MTQTDSSVTAVVTENFARGIASVNRMASVAGADVIPVDIGVMGEIKEPGVRNCRIANGTSNLRREPAMSPGTGAGGTSYRNPSCVGAQRYRI